MSCYIAVSDLELLGPEPKENNLKLCEGAVGGVVVGLSEAQDLSIEIGRKYVNYGVTLYKLVEIAHYASRECS